MLGQSVVLYSKIKQNAVSSSVVFMDLLSQELIHIDQEQAGLRVVNDEFTFPVWDKNTLLRVQL